MVVALTAGATPRTLVTGPLFRGAPDWGPAGILYVETDATVEPLAARQDPARRQRTDRGADGGFRLPDGLAALAALEEDARRVPLSPPRSLR